MALGQEILQMVPITVLLLLRAAVASWLVRTTQVCQSEGSGFKSRSGQIVYFHGVKTRLSTLGTGDVPGGSGFT